MTALVIGYGSIGKRHVRLLRSLVNTVDVVSSRRNVTEHAYLTIQEAIRERRPTYIVIANETSKHSETIHTVFASGYEGVMLVEKPVFHQMPMHLPAVDQVYVGYNLRFHPIIQYVHAWIQHRIILSAHIHVGQYLPSWRPDRDYRLSYSANRASGGGVLLDLSHELDYASWWFGRWKGLFALGGTYSGLEIDSDDMFTIVMETDRCRHVCIHMNYIDKMPQRKIVLNTETETLTADLIAGHIEINGKRTNFSVERDHTYIEQHKAMLSGDYGHVCSCEQGIEVLKLIEAARQSNQRKEWIRN